MRRPACDRQVSGCWIADDEALVRAGFRLLVEFADGLEVVGEAATGAQAVNQARGLRPRRLRPS